MGEFADMMINGEICHDCGSHITENGPGHFQICANCIEEENLSKDADREMIGDGSFFTDNIGNK